MKKFLLAAALAGSALAAPANAAYLGIEDHNSTISIYGGQFEGYFQVNMANANNLGAFNFADGATIGFGGKWIDLGLSVGGTHDIFVLASAGDTTAMSKLTYSLSTDGYWGYISGNYYSAGGYAFGTGATTILAGQNADFSDYYSSNTLYTDQVPEPAMLGLFGLGAIGLGPIPPPRESPIEARRERPTSGTSPPPRRSLSRSALERSEEKFMVSIPGALIGAALDRRDGDSGIKGALAGGLAPGAARKIFPILGALAFAFAARYALKRAGVTAENSGAVA